MLGLAGRPFVRQCDRGSRRKGMRSVCIAVSDVSRVPCQTQHGAVCLQCCIRHAHYCAHACTFGTECPAKVIAQQL